MVTSTQAADASSVYSALNASNSAAGKKNTTEETQDRFLKLLVTQMKNQDPLNPMDNAQVTSQMAQLSTVSGLDKVNATLQALSNNLTGNQLIQATSMMHRGVLIEGKDVELSEGAAIGGFELPQSAESVKVAIYDKAGSLVRNIELTNQAAGIKGWAWDGLKNDGKPADDGQYTFKVSASNTSQNGKQVDVTGLQYGVVNSVTQTKQGATLSIGQQDGISLAAVRQIL